MADLVRLQEAHILRAEFNYDLKQVERGYANRTLHIDLSTDTIESQPVTQQMKEIFTGGRGFGLKLLWDAVAPQTRWDDPENARARQAVIPAQAKDNRLFPLFGDFQAEQEIQADEDGDENV